MREIENSGSINDCSLMHYVIQGMDDLPRNKAIHSNRNYSFMLRFVVSPAEQKQTCKITPRTLHMSFRPTNRTKVFVTPVDKSDRYQLFAQTKIKALNALRTRDMATNNFSVGNLITNYSLQYYIVCRILFM